MAATLRGSVLEASDAAASNRFSAVAFSDDGEIMAVGADGRASGGTGRGGVYIYDRNGSGWTQRGSVLTASDAADNDNFGISVALSGDGAVLVVGAYQWEGGATSNVGGVYIFDKNGTGWTQRGSVLGASDAALTDNFGISVALSSNGNVLAVGALLWEGASGSNRGGIYIFDRNGSSWTQRGSVLEASDAADTDHFSAVSLAGDGEILIVGAKQWEGASGTNRGGVYIFDRNGSSWTQRGSVLEASDAADSDSFGRSVALSSIGFVLAVGAFDWEGASGTDRGGVYIYDKNGTGWTQRGSVLEASDAADTDRFGVSVNLVNGGLVMGVGAQQWESGATSDIGGVYVYDWDYTALAGAAAAVATATGELPSGAISGEAVAVATAAGDISTGIQLEGAAAGVATATGALPADNQLSGAAIAVADAAATLLTAIQASGNAAAVAAALGELLTAIQVAGNAAAIAAAAGELTTAIQNAGNAAAIASAAGDLTTYRPLFGDAAAVASATGALSLPEPPAKTFILGGLSIPFESHLDLNQDFEEEQSSRITRHSDGSARKQTAWRGKYRIRINGNGWYPPGLDMLDYEEQMEMSCIALRAVTSAERIITIPAARRSDQGFKPFAAVTIDGGKIDATISGIVGNVVTIAAVSGAQFYHVFYYPKIQVFASLPVQRHDAINDKYSWEMEAREI